MRAIMNIFKYKKNRLLKPRKIPGQTQSSPRKKVYEEFGIRNENKTQGDPRLKVSNNFDLLEEL